jgi:hypothetical protein
MVLHMLGPEIVAFACDMLRKPRGPVAGAVVGALCRRDGLEVWKFPMSSRGRIRVN